MAHIIITEENKGHLIDRAKGRFNQSEDAALAHINKIKRILEEQAPEDWRFTRSPVAKFFICDIETDFRILGRTYRDIGREFINELKDPKLEQGKIKELVDEYLRLIQIPDTPIYHELKTIYRRGQDISEVKKSYWAARKDLSHVIPVDVKRIAARPNAIITEDEEVWVRQDELLSLSNKDLEYLVFERLTPNGIDKSVIRVYIHDRHGNIKLQGNMIKQRSSDPIFLTRHELPSDFRTASYWSLPTYVDAEYLDLMYKQEHYPTEITADEALLIFRIELINTEVRAQLG
ncbi:MAG TPA: hypothetical protein VHT73_16040 [Thermodesulfobacteriota bacterium]|nr:hypothetical protein [Thermodesulfobacteriota bacterium]